MKKILFCALSMLLILMFTASYAWAADITFQVSVDQSSRQMNISGTISTGADQQVTVLVQSPDGAIDYLDQTTSGENGVFEFSYTLEEGKTGTYRIKVGGTDVQQAVTKTFEYTGDSEKKGSSSRRFSSHEVLGKERILKTEQGVRIQLELDPNDQEKMAYTLNDKTFGRMLEMLDLSDGRKQNIEFVMETKINALLDLPAETLKMAFESDANLIISFRTENGYNKLKLSDLQGQIPDQGSIRIRIHPADESMLNYIQELLGSGTTVYTALQFEIEQVRNDNTVTILDFNNIDIERGIFLTESVEPKTTTALMYIPDIDEMVFVPARFEKIDGQTVAMIQQNGNYLFAIVHHEQTFSDILSHWAKEEIELLASKYIIRGVSDDLFAPQRNINRAELTALFVRSFGLWKSDAASSFNDVDQDAWYARAVYAAFENGLISGYPDGSFRPLDPVTREQMMVMVSNVLEFAGKTPDVIGDAYQTIKKFSDWDKVSTWAVPSVAQVVEAGIIQGMTPDTLEPDRHLTRAEAAVIIKRTLEYLGFIH